MYRGGEFFSEMVQLVWVNQFALVNQFVLVKLGQVGQNEKIGALNMCKL